MKINWTNKNGTTWKPLMKLFLIMRLSFIITLCCFLEVSASTYSQNTKLDIKIKDANIKEIFEVIKNQSEFTFVYNVDDIEEIDKISCDFSGSTVEEVLDHCLEGTKMTYKVRDKVIIITPGEKVKIIPIKPDKQPQKKTITGKVTDNEGKPIPGVSIVVKGTTIGITSDIDGNFNLEIPDDAKFLTFSFVGLRSQEIEIAGKLQIDVVLEEDFYGLEEVVAVGYGTQKKVNVTGSVASISNENISNRPIPKMDEVLRGVTPNLNVSLSRNGGEPGASSNWNIRGVGSLSGSSAPLILVDGVEMNINNVDPSTVENISVLKDASASAIYGARAPFGVILITTKKGQNNGDVSVQYNNNFAFGSPIGLGHLENSMIYATVFNQASVNAGKTPIYDEDYLARIQGYLDGTYTLEYDAEHPPSYIWGGRRVGNANYDWPHEWVKDYKMDQKHNINLSGGTKKTQYYVSMGYFDQKGFLKYADDGYKRVNFLVNLNSKINDWMSFNVSSKFTNTNTDYLIGITTVDREYFWSSIYEWAPMTPKYNENGSIGNPWIRALQSSGRIKTKSNDFLITVGTELEPVKGWVTNVAYTYDIVQSFREDTPKPVSVELATGGYGNVGKPNATYSSSHVYVPYSLLNVVTSYEKSFKNHYFKILAGYEQEEKFFASMFGAGGILITDEVPSISTSLGTTTVDDTKYDWATQGIFGRLNYNYKEIYLIEFSARYNGSSRFAPESRWGFFPSGSVGYQVSKENFWEPIQPFVNSLKLRASYGSLGNQNVSSYLYIPTMPIHSQTPWILGGQRPLYSQVPSLISEDLTWETITTANFGVDAGFLDSRLNLGFDYFIRNTSNMFGPAETLPFTLGATPSKSNNAEMETKGFELILSWKNMVSSDLSYDVQLSLGDARSKIIKYRNEEGRIQSWYDGKEMGELWGFQTVGIIQTQEQADAMPDQSAIYHRWGSGDMQYKDVNGDGVITKGNMTFEDHGDAVVIGNVTPRYNLGVSGGVNWKNFDLSMQWFGVLKRDYHPALYDKTFQGLSSSWANSGILKGSRTLDYWRPEDETNMLGPNTDSYFPKPYFNAGDYDKNLKNQSRYVLNAAFMRLKFLQLGYTVPKSLSKKIFIENARVYVSGENLLTIKSLPDAMDPESSLHQPKQVKGMEWAEGGGGFYPMARTFSVGLNLTF